MNNALTIAGDSGFRLGIPINVRFKAKSSRCGLQYGLQTLLLLALVSSTSAAEPKLRHTINGHAEGVSSVAWNPGGNTLASGSLDSTIKLWDVKTRKDIATLEGHAEGVDTVAWSPDGKRLASVGDGEVKLWDVGTCKNVATFRKKHEWVNSVAWSPDGTSLALGNAEGAVRLRTVANGKTVGCLDAEGGLNVFSVTYRGDGKLLASADGCTIELWDVVSRRSINTLKGHSCDVITYAHGDYAGQYIPAIKSLAFRPDGKVLASGSQDKTIRLWDVATAKSIATLKAHSGSVESVTFSPDGKTLASASDDKTIRLWDVASGKCIATLTAHSAAVTSIAFSPDGKTLASASYDATIRLWDMGAAGIENP
jgi:WD40 repeat protein